MHAYIHTYIPNKRRGGGGGGEGGANFLESTGVKRVRMFDCLDDNEAA